MMSKTKAFLTLAILFALGIGGGCQTASIDNADNEQITVRHFNEYASFEGEEDIIEEFPLQKLHLQMILNYGPTIRLMSTPTARLRPPVI